MRTVAAASGVSLKTVSRALGGEPGVHEDTRAAVLAAAAKLGFRRNDLAASLRRRDGTVAAVGLITEDVGNPFYAVLTRGVEEVSRTRDCVLLTASSDEDPVLEREILGAFLARRVDGMIVVPAGDDHSYLARDLAAGTALVFVDRPATGLWTDSVVSANARGSADAVRHLLEHGHRRIGFVGDLRSLYTAKQRYLGYRRALRAAGIPMDAGIVRRDCRDVEQARAAAAQLLAAAEPPTAIFTANNRATVGVLRHARSGEDPHGRSVAVVGYDDFELADLMDPPVTVVGTDAHELGRAAAERLFARLDGDRRTPETLVLPAVLTPRGSGEIPPISPPRR